MATQLQEVYDAFFVKIPSHSFASEKSLVFQFLKTSVGLTSNTVKDNLTYTYDGTSYAGSFTGTLTQNTIELIALYMVREYYRRRVSKFEAIKQDIGTKDFNKLPNLKEPYEIAKSLFKDADSEIEDFRQEFYSYSN